MSQFSASPFLLMPTRSESEVRKERAWQRLMFALSAMRNAPPSVSIEEIEAFNRIVTKPEIVE